MIEIAAAVCLISAPERCKDISLPLFRKPDYAP